MHFINMPCVTLQYYFFIGSYHFIVLLTYRTRYVNKSLTVIALAVRRGERIG